MEEELLARARCLVELLKTQGKTVATAESLTGGLVAQAITTQPGASQVFGYGFVTYWEKAKTELVGVPASAIEKYTVVSGPVAAAMARGALERSGADLALALTGLAGPDGGTPQCPVGRVYIAAADSKTTWVEQADFGAPGRQAVRQLAAARALALGQKLLLGQSLPPNAEEYEP